MLCLKCGNEIKDNEQICSNCGYNKNTISNNDNPYGIKSQGIYNQNPVDQEKVNERLEQQKQFNQLLEIYIGNKFYNFKKGSFSWCAFLLGPIYYIYRKLYGIGIIVYIINILIDAFLTRIYMGPLRYMILISIFGLIVNLFLGFTFKETYFNECIERIAKIKHKNPNLGFNQLAEITRVKGGTNLLAALLVIIIPIILIIIFAIVFTSIFVSIISQLGTIRI